jgi:3',5'-cyclic-AMP phosphodiesterase
MTPGLDRRTFLAALAAGAGGVGVMGLPGARGLRLAYVTDPHVEPGTRPEEGYARALEAVASLSRPAHLLVNGGDAIFTALNRDADDVAAQFRSWKRVLDAGNRLPTLHCLGNHDVWGWGLRDDPAVRHDPRYGKRWALEAMELEAPWYHVDRGGWRIVVLDSTFPGEDFDYQARLGPEQFEWLEGVLSSTPVGTPICLVSHIPLVSVAALHWFGDAPGEVERRVIDQVLVHRDGREIVELLRRHPGVRLCLSGHLHVEERLEYRGVTYLNVAAVSGNWWNAETPDFRGFAPGFAVIELFPDGGFEFERHRLGVPG